jgi:ABC-2 type transport system ATP-binding protein
MVHAPAILILDEPEAGLDPQSRILVRERLRALARAEGRSVLVSTHDMDEVERIADRVAIMDHGELLALDSPEGLRQKRGAANVVEIRLDAGDPDAIERARALVSESQAGVRVREGSLCFATDDGPQILGPIRDRLAAAAVVPQEVRLRRWSIEDLFIELTGRRLRQ